MEDPVIRDAEWIVHRFWSLLGYLVIYSILSYPNAA